MSRRDRAVGGGTRFEEGRRVVDGDDDEGEVDDEDGGSLVGGARE